MMYTDASHFRSFSVCGMSGIRSAREEDGDCERWWRNRSGLTGSAWLFLHLITESTTGLACRWAILPSEERMSSNFSSMPGAR